LKIILIISLSLLCVLQLNAQKDSTHLKRYQAVYIEIGGPSTIASLNYEMGLLQKKRLKLNVRIGLGFTRFKDFSIAFNPDITVPIGLSTMLLLLDRNKGILHIELMGGNTISSYVKADNNYQPHREFDNHGYISAGPSWTFNKGLYTRLAYCLLLEKYKTPLHWGGISIGYKFK
tara:strand:- start:1086 stop:1610 length:525 start_codon:yes stop_codon:yes gene_type:complete